MSLPHLIALDGHDGAGKSTLAPRLADALGGEVASPFGAANGLFLAEAARREDWEGIIAFTRFRLLDIRRAATHDIVVCDRAWLTMLTLMPAPLYITRDDVSIPTAVLWCDLATTLQRVQFRLEERSTSVELHQRYLDRYRLYGVLYGCPIIRTDSLNESSTLDALTSWARSVLP